MNRDIQTLILCASFALWENPTVFSVQKIEVITIYYSFPESATTKFPFWGIFFRLIGEISTLS